MAAVDFTEEAAFTEAASTAVEATAAAGEGKSLH
jgi:hypothetical protein